MADTLQDLLKLEYPWLNMGLPANMENIITQEETEKTPQQLGITPRTIYSHTGGYDPGLAATELVKKGVQAVGEWLGRPPVGAISPEALGTFYETGQLEAPRGQYIREEVKPEEPVTEEPAVAPPTKPVTEAKPEIPIPTPPAIREPKEGEFPIKPEVPKVAEVPVVPTLPKPVIPTIQPIPEEMKPKSPEYWANQIASWRAAKPKTLDEAMMRAGIEPSKYTIEGKNHWLADMLINFGYGMLGKDANKERATIEAKLQAKKVEQVNYILSYLADDEKLWLTQLTMEQAADGAKTKNLQDMLTKQAEANPYVKQNPNWWRQMGVAFRLPQSYIESWLESHKQPDGTYKDLWMSPVEQMFKEAAAKAEQMKISLPGYPDEVYKIMAITGKWPEWADDFKKLKQHQIALESDPIKRFQLQKEVDDFERTNLALGWGRSLNLFSEMITKLPISDKDKQQMIKDYFGTSVGIVAPGVAELYTAREKEKEKGRWEVAKEQAKAGVGLKPGEQIKAWEYETVTKGPLAVAALAFPEARAGAIGDPYSRLIMKTEEVKGALNRFATRDQTPEDAVLLAQWRVAQNRRITQLNPSVLATIQKYGINDPNYVQEIITNLEHPEYGFTPEVIKQDIITQAKQKSQKAK